MFYNCVQLGPSPWPTCFGKIYSLQGPMMLLKCKPEHVNSKPWKAFAVSFRIKSKILSMASQGPEPLVCRVLLVSFALLSSFKFAHSSAWTAVPPTCFPWLFPHLLQVLGPWSLAILHKHPPPWLLPVLCSLTLTFSLVLFKI